MMWNLTAKGTQNCKNIKIFLVCVFFQEFNLQILGYIFSYTYKIVKKAFFLIHQINFYFNYPIKNFFIFFPT